MVVLASEGLPENSICLRVSLACKETTSLTARSMGSMLAPWTLLSGCANTWWRHQMETISTLLALCAGNSPVSGEFPSQRPVTRSFDVFFDLCPNKRLGKQLWGWWLETPSGSLWRHCNENGVGMHGISCGGGWGVGVGDGILWRYRCFETNNEKLLTTYGNIFGDRSQPLIFQLDNVLDSQQDLSYWTMVRKH